MVQGSRRDRIEKDGIIAQEGLVLRHSKTGQRIFVVHGHQADFTSDRLCIVGRFVVRNIWKRVQLLDLVQVTSRGACPKTGKDRTENRQVECNTLLFDALEADERTVAVCCFAGS